MQGLEQKSYGDLLKESIESKKRNKSMKITVKSYFWASRTINNCKCLPRSIALYQGLKAEGYQVEHKFGINNQNKSLAAHAWVEYDNKPLNESNDLKQRFAVMNSPD